VIALGRWLVANTGPHAGWPIDVVVERVGHIFEHGKITREECAELRDLFRDLAGDTDGVPLGRNSSTRLPLTDPAPEIQFAGRCFVFTGKFIYGTRRACEREVFERGGTCHPDVGIRTDVVVVGYIGSVDWTFTNFGRKIEKAVANIRSGAQTVIIAEEHWLKFLTPESRVSTTSKRQFQGTLIQENGAWIGRCADFPDLVVLAPSREEALAKLKRSVEEILRRPL